VLKVHTALMLEQGIDLIEDTWGNNNWHYGRRNSDNLYILSVVYLMNK